jgi:hypothetical protein
MYDKPTLSELLDAVYHHLENRLLPALSHDPKLVYETRAALDVLKIAERELTMSLEHLRSEWARLNFLLDAAAPMPADPAEAAAALAERNRRLCDQIASGAYDSGAKRAALFEHLLMTAHAQLEVSSPDFLQTLAREDEDRNRTR